MGDHEGVPWYRGRILYQCLISLLLSTATAHTGNEITYLAARGSAKLLLITCLDHTLGSICSPSKWLSYAGHIALCTPHNPTGGGHFVAHACWIWWKRKCSVCTLQGDMAGGSSSRKTLRLPIAAQPAALPQRRFPTGAMHAFDRHHWAPLEAFSYHQITLTVQAACIKSIFWFWKAWITVLSYSTQMWIVGSFQCGYFWKVMGCTCAGQCCLLLLHPL